MRENERDSRSAKGFGLASAGPTAQRRAPRLVLGGGTGFAAQAADHFRRLGWDVKTANSAADARQLALAQSPHAVVMPADFGAESGFLTCAKLVADQPRMKVVLFAEDASPRDQRFGDFVGATAVVREADGVTKLVKAVVGSVPPSAN